MLVLSGQVCVCVWANNCVLTDQTVGMYLCNVEVLLNRIMVVPLFLLGEC